MGNVLVHYMKSPLLGIRQWFQETEFTKVCVVTIIMMLWAPKAPVCPASLFLVLLHWPYAKSHYDKVVRVFRDPSARFLECQQYMAWHNIRSVEYIGQACQGVSIAVVVLALLPRAQTSVSQTYSWNMLTY